MRIRERYDIQKTLGRGGFGVTFLAEDTLLGQQVVLKQYRPENLSAEKTDRDLRSRRTTKLTDRRKRQLYLKGKEAFLREAKTLSSLSEVREIVKVLDYFEEGDTAYIVLEYVRGISLRRYLESRDEPMGFDEAWDFLLPTLNALEKIHEKGLIHRDINPDNLLVRKDGSIRIIDFGSARIYRESEYTMTALVKKGYAPPEQYEERGKQGPWTDVYAFCATLYEMITGVVPPSSPERRVNDSLYLPSSYGTAITPQQEMVLMRGMAPEYKKRYASFSDMRDALLPQAEEKPKRNWKHVLIASTAIVLALFAVAAGVFHFNREEKLAVARKNLTVGQYGRDSTEHIEFLNLLKKYGKFEKDSNNNEKIYCLPRWVVEGSGMICDSPRLEKTKGEYLSMLRRKGFSLTLEEHRYRGDVYITPYGGTVTTYFTWRDTYSVGNGDVLINVTYDITTRQITYLTIYEKDKTVDREEMVPISAETLMFLSDDWNGWREYTRKRLRGTLEGMEEKYQNGSLGYEVEEFQFFATCDEEGSAYFYLYPKGEN